LGQSLAVRSQPILLTQYHSHPGRCRLKQRRDRAGTRLRGKTRQWFKVVGRGQAKNRPPRRRGGGTPLRSLAWALMSRATRGLRAPQLSIPVGERGPGGSFTILWKWSLGQMNYPIQGAMDGGMWATEAHNNQLFLVSVVYTN